MNLILAPMQGLLDPVMRRLLTDIGGYSECVTEFVRITHTLHSRATWRRHMPEIDHGCRTHAGIPCTLQLLGSDPDNMAANAQAAVAAGAQKIDLNFGCPAPTVNKHQGGAILLREPERIRQIVSTVRQRLPENIPLTAKMRLGYEDSSRALECAQAIAQGGASSLAVHARTKIEGYRPPIGSKSPPSAKHSASPSSPTATYSAWPTTSPSAAPAAANTSCSGAEPSSPPTSPAKSSATTKASRHGPPVSPTTSCGYADSSNSAANTPATRPTPPPASNNGSA